MGWAFSARQTFRTSCRSRFIHQCWKHFVFYIVGTRCTPSLWKQGCIKLIFRFSFGTWRTGHQETGGRNPWGMTGQIRTTRWQTSRSGYRSSEVAAPAHISQDSESEHPTKVATRKHRIKTHFPKKPKLRNLQANQFYVGSWQKTHWRSSTSRRKVGWLDNGGLQSPQWGRWIQRQSLVRCRDTRSCHSMDSIKSVQTQRLHKSRRTGY